MSLKSIIKVANYYNVKYSFESEPFESEDDDTSGNEFKNLRAKYTGGELGKDDDFRAKVEITGKLNDINFKIIDTIPVYLEKDKDGGYETNIYESHFIEGGGNESTIIIDGEEVTRDSIKSNPVLKEKYESFDNYFAFEGGDEKIIKVLAPLKNEILEDRKDYFTSVFSDRVSDYADQEEEARDPYGYRGLRKSDFY